jgi:hypothetical protein
LVALSLAFVTSYKLIPNDPGNLHFINVCRTVGKVAIAGDLLASGIAIGGLFFDRRKALALLVVIAGISVAGIIGCLSTTSDKRSPQNAAIKPCRENAWQVPEKRGFR